MIVIGCIGGKYRFVIVVEEFKKIIENQGYKVLIFYRDIEKDIKG